MQRKLTITIDEDVYAGLHKVIGPRKISRFIEDLARPHVVGHELEAAYKAMSKDRLREKEAIDWAEGTFGDSVHEEG
jgi:predicted CopG family antitoxin